MSMAIVKAREISGVDLGKLVQVGGMTARLVTVEHGGLSAEKVKLCVTTEGAISGRHYLTIMPDEEVAIERRDLQLRVTA